MKNPTKKILLPAIFVAVGIIILFIAYFSNFSNAALTEEQAQKKLEDSSYYKNWLIDLQQNRPENSHGVIDGGLNENGKYIFQLTENNGVNNANYGMYEVNPKTGEVKMID